MIRINLLPWRYQARRRRRRRFYGLLGLVATGAAAAVMATWLAYSARLADQRAHNQMAARELASLAAQRAQAFELQEQLEALARHATTSKALRAERRVAAGLFEHLPHALPDGARLSRLSLHEDRLSVAGAARTSRQISDFLTQLEGAGGLSETDLQAVVAGDGGYEFRIQARVQP